MLYDPKLLDVEWDNTEHRYSVWYDNTFAGFVARPEDAHDLMVVRATAGV